MDEILNLIESISEGFPSYFWLGKVVGNLAQAKTGSTQDPFVLNMFCNEFVPLRFHPCDSLKKILIVK